MHKKLIYFLSTIAPLLVLFLLVAIGGSTEPTRQSPQTIGVFQWLFLAIVALGAVFLYTLPAFISASRNSPNFIAILLINIFLGWTVVGYIAMLIWACVDNVQPNKVVNSGNVLPPQ